MHLETDFDYLSVDPPENFSEIQNPKIVKFQVDLKRTVHKIRSDFKQLSKEISESNSLGRLVRIGNFVKRVKGFFSEVAPPNPYDLAVKKPQETAAPPASAVPASPPAEKRLKKSVKFQTPPEIDELEREKLEEIARSVPPQVVEEKTRKLLEQVLEEEADPEMAQLSSLEISRRTMEFFRMKKMMEEEVPCIVEEIKPPPKVEENEKKILNAQNELKKIGLTFR
jgi:hypothetical protein